MRWRVAVKESDALAVRKLVTETGFFSAEEQNIAVELVDERLAQGPASGYEFVFADKPGGGEGLLGYTCYGPIPNTTSDFDLYWIAVAPSQQRLGLGSQLLQESERLAMLQGATHMYIDTSGRASYAPTRAFYERMGYAIASRIEDFYAPGDGKVIYRKELPSQV